MRTDARAIAERICGLILAAVLLRSAASHLGNEFQFLSSLYAYRILGVEQAAAAASAVPTVQLTLAVCLTFGWWRRGAYLAAGLLFLVFVGVQISALQRGLEISCGCFGAADSVTVGPATLSIAGGCAVLSALGFFLTRLETTPCDATYDAASR